MAMRISNLILNDIISEENLLVSPNGIIYDPFDREEEHDTYQWPKKKYMTLKNILFVAHTLNNMDHKGIVLKTEIPALIKIVSHILPDEKPKMVERVAVALKQISNYWWIFYGMSK